MRPSRMAATAWAAPCWSSGGRQLEGGRWRRRPRRARRAAAARAVVAAVADGGHGLGGLVLVDGLGEAPGRDVPATVLDQPHVLQGVAVVNDYVAFGAVSRATTERILGPS